MLEYYKKNWIKCSIVIIISIFVAILSIFQGVMLQLIVDTAVGNLYLKFINLVIMVFLYVIINFSVNYIYKRNLYSIATSAIAYIKDSLIGSFVNEKNINTKDIAEKLAIIEKDTSQVFENYLLNFFSLINMIILFIAASIYLLSINVFLAIVVLGSGFVSLILPQFFINKAQIINKDYLDKNKNFYQDIKELVYGLTTIKMYGLEEKFKKKDQNSNHCLEQSHNKQLSYQAFIGCLNNSTGFFILACNVVLAGYLSFKGYFSIGTVLAVMQVMNFIMTPLIQIPGIIIEMKSIRPAIDSIDKSIENTKISIIKSDCIKFNSLEFKEVYFKKPESDEFILKNINARFIRGKKYAIVGLSGSGKSTMLNLITGLQKGYKGSILINNEKELQELPIDIWRKIISTIEQSIFIFNDSINFNICFEEKYIEKDFFNLLGKVGLEEFVKNRDNGLESILGNDGEKISGGEKQRLAIARAFFKNSDIILADEPTSGLDSSNSNNIENALLDNKRTVINITHRLREDILNRYDEIICIKDGRITGIGKFSELVKNNQYFQMLCEHYRDD